MLKTLLHKKEKSTNRLKAVGYFHESVSAVLTKAASSTIFWVFGITRPGIEPRSSRPLVNIQLIKPMARYWLSIGNLRTILGNNTSHIDRYIWTN